MRDGGGLTHGLSRRYRPFLPPVEASSPPAASTLSGALSSSAPILFGGHSRKWSRGGRCKILLHQPPTVHGQNMFNVLLTKMHTKLMANTEIIRLKRTHFKEMQHHPKVRPNPQTKVVQTQQGISDRAGSPLVDAFRSVRLFRHRPRLRANTLVPRVRSSGRSGAADRIRRASNCQSQNGLC